MTDVTEFAVFRDLMEADPWQWWHKTNGDTFMRLGLELISVGYTAVQAYSFLSDARNAMRDEYGE